MKLIIICHAVFSVTLFRYFLSTFKSIHCCTALNYREFLLLNVLKIMLQIYYRNQAESEKGKKIDTPQL